MTKYDFIQRQASYTFENMMEEISSKRMVDGELSFDLVFNNEEPSWCTYDIEVEDEEGNTSSDYYISINSLAGWYEVESNSIIIREQAGDNKVVEQYTITYTKYGDIEDKEMVVMWLEKTLAKYF